MSRGQSQSKTGKRSLERLKDKGKYDHVIIIDVDKARSPNTVIVDVSETSPQRKRSSALLRTNKKCPPRGIISIDDEEGGNDDGPQSGDIGDLESDATSSKKYCPVSSQSHFSKQSDSDDCQIFNQVRNFPFKLSKCKQKDPETGPSRNRFGLFIDSDSTSESDSSDCELVEDSSGKIRKEWEKAASRKKVQEHVLNRSYRAEDWASASGSNSDPRTSSHKTACRKFNVEKNRDQTFSSTAEQAGDASVYSNSSNASSEKEIVSNCMASIDKILEDPFLQPEGHHLDADSDQTVDQSNVGNPVEGEPLQCNVQPRNDSQTNHDRAGFQTKGAVPGELEINHGRASFQHKEEPVSGATSEINANSQYKVDVDLNQSYFQDTEVPYCGEPSSSKWDKIQVHFESKEAVARKPELNHGRASFQNREEPVPWAPSEINTKSLHEMNGYHNEFRFQEKEPSYHGEASSFKWDNTQVSFQSKGPVPGEPEDNHERVLSQNKEQPAPQAPSEINAKKQNEMGVNHNRSYVQEMEEPYCEKPSLSRWDKTQLSHETVCNQEKEEGFPGESSSCDAQLYKVRARDESGNCLQKERAVLGKPYMCNNKGLYKTQVNSGKACLQDKEEFEYSVVNIQPHDETPGRSIVLHAANMDGQLQNGDLIAGREKLKETDEFKRAAEEEWAARQRQLKLQAEEAQRLKKKRKAETMRLLDMQRRQQQRLEEMRETQKKDEETINLKEQLRIEIRKELEKLELKYKDMASLLRGLGIHVRGGPCPTSHEVNAAYKQALLKFHPDRTSKSDVRQQVEAEETFKLISRLKEKLLPKA